MMVYAHPNFPYPNLWSGQARCGVEVYRWGMSLLVVLRDYDDHCGTSLTNAIETVARKVRAEILIPRELDGLEVRWVEWSFTDNVYSLVTFRDPERLAGPQWRRLSLEDFEKIRAVFSR